jgi:hypothetical protein
MKVKTPQSNFRDFTHANRGIDPFSALTGGGGGGVAAALPLWRINRVSIQSISPHAAVNPHRIAGLGLGLPIFHNWGAHRKYGWWLGSEGWGGVGE